MAKQVLNDTDIHTPLQKVGREAVPQRMNRDSTIETDRIGSLAECTLHRSRRDRQ
jgi:hypothetical protein